MKKVFVVSKTHLDLGFTELLDVDSLDYGLSIVEELDKLRGRKKLRQR